MIKNKFKKNDFKKYYQTSKTPPPSEKKPKTKTSKQNYTKRQQINQKKPQITNKKTPPPSQKKEKGETKSNQID